MRRSSVSAIAVLAALALGCDDSVRPDGFQNRIGAVVLNGVGETGVTIVPYDSRQVSRIGFPSFDGDRFTLAGTLVLSTSSSFSGDQLYVADLAAGSLRRVQLPQGSNPAGAAAIGLVGGAASRQGFAVALRNTGSLACVDLQAASGDTVRLAGGAGLCPWDVIVHGCAAWSVDANQRCAGQFEVEGSARLIRVPVSGPERDTVELGDGAVSATRAFVAGDFAFVLSGGCPPFLAGCTDTPGAVTKVNLAARTVVSTRALPAGIYALAMRLGEDGRLYVTGAQELFGQGFAPRVYAIDAGTMSFVRSLSATEPYVALFRTPGVLANCYAATADAQGRIYCVENGQTVSTLLVFDDDGQAVRAVPAGTPAFDVHLR